MWHPEPAQLGEFRRLVDTDPDRVHTVIDDPRFVGMFGHLEGNRLSRVPKGFRPDHPEADLLKLKDVGFARRLSDADVTSAALPDLLAETLEVGVPAMRLLATLPV